MSAAATTAAMTAAMNPQWGGMVKSDARQQAEAAAAKGDRSLLKTLGKLAIRIAIVVAIGIGSAWGVGELGAAFDSSDLTTNATEFYDSIANAADGYGEFAKPIVRGGAGLLAGMADVPGTIIDGVTEFFTTDPTIEDIERMNAEVTGHLSDFQTNVDHISNSLESLKGTIAGLDEGPAKTELTAKYEAMIDAGQQIKAISETISDGGVLSIADTDKLTDIQSKLTIAFDALQNTGKDLAYTAALQDIDLPHIGNGAPLTIPAIGVGGAPVHEVFSSGLLADARDTTDALFKTLQERLSGSIDYGNVALAGGGAAAAYAGGKALSAAATPNVPQAPNPNDMLAALGPRAAVHGPRSQAMRDAQINQMLAAQYGVDDPAMAAQMQAAQMTGRA